MPGTAQALRLTDSYRQRSVLLRTRAQAVARSRWGLVDGADLDGTHAQWTRLVAPALVELQRAGVRLSNAYIAGFLTVELGHAVHPAGASATSSVIGTSRAGKPLTEALDTSLFTTKAAIREGRDLESALALGLARAVRNAGEDVTFAGRQALDTGILAEPRIIGWRRVTGGGCGACIAAATGAIQADSETLLVHDGCQCSKEPVIAEVDEHHTRPTGHDIFNGLTPGEQDALLGEEKANLVRSGEIPLHALIEHSPMEAIADQITERPLHDLRALAA